MKNKVPKLLRSSQNPEQVSLTIKGLLTLLLPALMVYAKYAGATAEEVNDVVTFVTSVSTTAVTLYGLIRKFKK